MSSNAAFEKEVTLRLQTYFFETCISCSVIGIQLFMCIYGLTVFLETPKNLRQGRLIYVFISFVILGLYCFAEIPLAYYTYVLLDKPCTRLDTVKLQDKLERTWWSLADIWGSVLLFWLGDGLLVYRCYVVWTNQQYVAILPGAVYLAAVATSAWFTIATQLEFSRETTRIAYSAFLALSALISCIVTPLIAGRLLHMRNKQAKIITGVAVDSKVYFSIISVLVESAVPLAITGFMGAVMLWVKADNHQTASDFFVILWQSLTALSPQFIILRVTLGRSWAHRSHSVKESHLSTLAFQPRSLHESNATGHEFEDSAYRNNAGLQDRMPFEDPEGAVKLMDVTELLQVVEQVH
ncbi:hypothetical protein CPB83DRAFT_905947 [Crepidotus variabilis]|uniref:Uncharacterized protein n=1 Tax=Crepidotus variabilis TaxID=179855 RepID=A0A9P6EI87_9AGAR|nr:hypothetical protein CPB83DRAFT_905947 [Crepidotus variabilis]